MLRHIRIPVANLVELGYSQEEIEGFEVGVTVSVT